MSESHAGRFVWRELIAPDLDPATRFYADLFGWDAHVADMGGVQYTMIKAGERDVGGATLPPEGREVPPHWLDYITVDDVDAAAARAPGLGGQVLMAPFDIPNVGRAAIIADPGGAVFAAFHSLTPGATDTDSPAADHTFCWAAVMTRDLEAIVPFYEGLFGWTAQPAGEGQVWFLRGETAVASAQVLPKDANAPSHWLDYVQVPDVDAAYERIAALGGSPRVPPQDIPGMGRFAILADAAGAPVALWKNA